MKTQQRRGMVQRTLSVIGTAALALTGVYALGSTAAFASPGEIVAPTDGGSIILHKHSSNPGSAGTGFEITDPAAQTALGSGIGNIPFKLYKVAYDGTELDLGDPADWRDDLPATKAEAESGLYSLVDVTPAAFTTDAAGLLTFSGLDLGLYVVEEQLNSVIPAADMADPFVVSVPHRATDDSTWNYNVHVYPKNKLPDTPTKIVGDPTGNVVPWTITVPVPRPASGQIYLDDMTITDTLDNRLTYVSSTIAKNGGAAVAAAPSVDGQLVTWTIPKAELYTGDTYVIILQTTVTEPGEVPNTAYRNLVNDRLPTGTVQTNWGAVKVIKHEAETNKTLAGAKFELWTADCEAGSKVLDAVETGANGEVIFAHVWLGNDTIATKDFCLKETQAPTGYSISNEWTPVTLNAANTGIVEKTILNTPRTTPNLPLTGSAGTAAFMAGGLALLLTASGAALIVSRRRRETNATK